MWFFDQFDHYWTVTDTNPSTHVFSSKKWFAGATAYVVLADADYVAWVATGGQKATIATDDALKFELNRIALSRADRPAKHSCRVATTGNITLSGEQTIDGVAVVAGDRVLVRAQTDPLEDQIYICQAGAWEYATDVDTSQKLIGATVIVVEGTNNAKSLWMTDWATDNVIGTDQVAWYPIGGIRSAALPENTVNAASDTFLFWNNGVLPSRVAFDDLSTALAADSAFTGAYQPLDATLTAWAAYNTNGILTQAAADTFTGRTITGTANEITLTNGNGVSGNPTVSLPTALTFTGKTVTGGTFSGIQKALTFSDGYIEVNDATYTVGDDINCIVCNRAGTITLTLPTASSWLGREIKVQTYTANAVDSASSNVVAAGGGAAATAILAATAGKWAHMVSDGTNWRIIMYN